MEAISSVITYILGFKVYVMLPVVIFIFAMIFRLNIKISVTSALAIGIGFIGIFITFDFFIATIGPALKILVARTGLSMNVLDVGWPPLASIAWSFRIAPVMILVIIAVNILMLLLRITRVVNIDIWNFWHFLMVGALVNAATSNICLAVAAVITAEIIVIKIGEWGAPHVQRYAKIPGVAITTLSVGAYYPAGVLGNALIDKIPFINRLKADPVSLKKKLGLAGEPVIIGFVMGLLLGFGGGYDLKKILELAFSIAAVVVILPAMCGILTSGLIPISEGMKGFVKRKLPHLGETYIGLDNAVLMGDPAIIVSGLLLMPVALVLAFTLPGIKFIPLGDLPNTMALVAMFVVATRGNVVRTFLIGIPVITAQLYVASYMADTFTKLAADAHFTFTGYSGTITSYLDGGLPLRLWLYKLFSGSTIALIATPAVIAALFLAWYISKKELVKEDNAEKKKVRSKK
jgi:galactitol PTS system EIIC component